MNYFYHESSGKKFLRRLIAPALFATLLSMPATSYADFYMAYCPGSEGWQFNIPMSQTNDGKWTIETDLSSLKDGENAFYTFFDGVTKEWTLGDGVSRYGAENENPVSPDTEYTIVKGVDKCFKINQAGKYTITIDPENLKFSYTSTGTIVNPEPTPDPEPEPEPEPTPDPDVPTITSDYYVFFNKPSNWTGVNVWAWNAANGDANCNHNGNWPGDEMKPYNGDTYYWEAPAGKIPDHIIFSNSANSDDKAGSGDLDYFNKATYSGDGSHTGGVVTPPTPPTPPTQEGPGAVKNFSYDNSTVTVTCENATLKITPYSGQIVKVFTLPTGSSDTERRSITVSALPNANFTVSDDELNINIIIEDGLLVTVDRQSGLISYHKDTHGDLGSPILSEAKYLRNEPGNRTVTFNPMYDEAFYGGGYNGHSESLLDHPLVMNNSQSWGWNSETSGSRTINIPFVVSTKGYGILFDDHYRDAKINPSSSGLSYSSSSTSPISYYFVGGGSLDEVVANYTSLTGRQPLPPYWALGYITSRYGYHSETEAQGIIDGIKNSNLPLDGIVFDLYWQGNDESGMGNLDWYSQNFSKPKDMLSRWKEDGIHTTLITEPFFTSKSANYDTLKDRGYFADDNVSGMDWLQSPQVGLLDASNPDALKWMWDFYKARTEEGVDGWWLDLGEPERHDSDSHHMGGTVEEVHNEFGNLWVESVYNGFRSTYPETRPFIMPRAGTSGMQRFSTFPWTGDIERSWSGLRAQIPSLVNMSMAGVSFIGSDVGGFAGKDTNPDLYRRWVQFAALSPMLRTHSAYKPEPTNAEYSGILDDVRDYINLRYRILPYTYTLAYENSAFGYPMARPACAFDENKSILGTKHTDSYLWGRDIFVAPVVGDNNPQSRDITFPDGEWLDLHEAVMKENGKPGTYAGSFNGFPAPSEKLPFFLRKGGFLPTFTKTSGFKNTTELSYSDLTIYHFMDPDKNNRSKVYFDDRISYSALENGKHSIINFEGYKYDVVPGTDQYVISINTDEYSNLFGEVDENGNRTYHFHIYGFNYSSMGDMNITRPAAPAQKAVRRAGSLEKEPEVDKVVASNSLDEAKNSPNDAIYYDKENAHVYMKVTRPATQNFAIGFGDTTTGVEEIEIAGAPRLFCSRGNISYSVPGHYADAFVEIFSADGRLICRYNDIQSDGICHSIESPEAEGLCIVRLTATAPDNTKKTAHAKYMAR